MLADLAFLAQPLERVIQRVREGVLGILPAIGVSLLDAARAVAFHEIDYFSLLSRILVLFTAMVAVIVGIALLGSRSARTAGADYLHASTIGEEETEEWMTATSARRL
jgi:hypothetical protein